MKNKLKTNSQSENSENTRTDFSNKQAEKAILAPIETVEYLNAEILTITLKIKEKNPELSKYIEEMPVTVPTELDPEITRSRLKTYHNSLKSLLNKYLLENPEGQL